MKLTCPNIQLHLILEDELLESLYQVGMQHYPKEFGGLLIGAYSDDFKTCTVTGCILPLKYKSSRYSFERGREGLLEKLESFYNRTPRSIYIGEWHTHPDGSTEPSNTDMATMQTISNHDEVNITCPLLLILSVNHNGFTPGFYVNYNNKLYKYE